MAFANKKSSKGATRAINAVFALVFVSLFLTACDQTEPEPQKEPQLQSEPQLNEELQPQKEPQLQSEPQLNEELQLKEELQLEADVDTSPVFNSTVRLTTELGNIDIELFATAAPITSANFLAYIDAGLYSSNGENQMTFYRTVRDDNQAQNNIKISVIQGGLLDKSMSPVSNSLPPIAHETTKQTGILHTDGIVSLARLDPGTGSSEFFIVLGDQPSLDFGGQRNPDGQGFAAFGKVVRGMDIVRTIHQAKTITPEGDGLSYTSGQLIEQPIKVFSSERVSGPIE